MATVKKIAAADRSYGRGMDNVYYPARYGVFNKHGQQVAQVVASQGVRYMEKADWKVVWEDAGVYKCRYFTWAGFKAAKAWAESMF